MSKPNERAVFVAALRELADLVEGDESLPVPFHNGMQVGFFGTREDGTYRSFTYAEKVAQLRAFAEKLGVDVVESDDGTRIARRRVGPIEYYAHINARADIARCDTKRVVSADEDAALIGGGR